MIKINLMPYKEEKRKDTFLQQVIFAGVSVLILAVVILFMMMYIFQSTRKVQNEIAETDTAIQKLRPVEVQMQKLKEMEKRINKRLASIASLESNKFGPVFFLEDLSLSTPDKMWLTSYSENDRKGENQIASEMEAATKAQKDKSQAVDVNPFLDNPEVKIEGDATDFKTIANFMVKLEQSQTYKNVELNIITQEQIRNIKIMKFSLDANLNILGIKNYKSPK